MIADRRHWSELLRDCETRGEPYVIVTVLAARGSTPRNSGTKMLVEAAGFAGTIGGGELEHRALSRAQAMLQKGLADQWTENFPLGEKLGQCCGGATTLLFECFIPESIAVYLFGAGHVGRALAPLLSTLPIRLTWVDSRAHEFPDPVPGGVHIVCDDDPVGVVRQADTGSYFLIMTHQHPLDFALAQAALEREDAAYVGVIGSASKSRRFRLRLAHRGMATTLIDKLRCPVGHSDVPGKRPAEIAVAVAAELIGLYHAQRAASDTPQGPAWKTLRQQLQESGANITDTQQLKLDTP